MFITSKSSTEKFILQNTSLYERLKQNQCINANTNQKYEARDGRKPFPLIIHQIIF